MASESLNSREPWGGLVMSSGIGNHFPGVLDPQGPIARAERLILLDSTAIMLAIIIPTILATAALRVVVQGG